MTSNIYKLLIGLHDNGKRISCTQRILYWELSHEVFEIKPEQGIRRRVEVFIGLAMHLLVFLPVDRHQPQLHDDMKRRSSGSAMEAIAAGTEIELEAMLNNPKIIRLIGLVIRLVELLPCWRSIKPVV